MAYRVIDEPQPSPLEQVIVNPIWPFFASIFAGSWLAFPWFVVNAFALGGRQRFVDLAIAVTALAVNALVLWFTAGMLEDLSVGGQAFGYVELLPMGLRLAVLYWLFMRQSSLFELHTHFGGAAKNGVLIVVAGFFLRGRVMSALPPYWQLLLT